MADLAKRNAKVARLEASRKVVLARKKAKQVAVGQAAGAVLRTCECGRLLKGAGAWNSHRRHCEDAQGTRQEPKP